MTVNKRKKNSRQKGSHTFGCGSKKKRRGSGNRGGFGMAGSGKRADQRKPSLWKERYFGKRGFTSKTHKEEINAINLMTIKEKIKSWVSEGTVSSEDGAYNIDLEELGYNKLLSKGNVSLKLKIKSPYASESAVEKVKQAGGKVTGLISEAKE